jgi:hypothetical protein
VSPPVEAVIVTVLSPFIMFLVINDTVATPEELVSWDADNTIVGSEDEKVIGIAVTPFEEVNVALTCIDLPAVTVAGAVNIRVPFVLLPPQACSKREKEHKKIPNNIRICFITAPDNLFMLVSTNIFNQFNILGVINISNSVLTFVFAVDLNKRPSNGMSIKNGTPSSCNVSLST